MAETILSKFDSGEEAARAVRELMRSGVGRDSILLMSAEPLGLDAPEETAPSRIGLFSVAGALLGAAVALVLTIATSRATGLITGGMPILAFWTFGIIVFELTALGAILGALGRMIVEARLARPGAPDGYDGEVSDGKVLLSVRCRDTSEYEAASSVLDHEGTRRNTKEKRAGPIPP